MQVPARCLPALAAAALFALLAGPGCTRKHFRERADKDVEGVITQKNVFPDWQVKNWHAYPDPRARFADQTNPDRPPYPPDDYAARVMSPNPQKPTHRSGVGRVDGTGYVALLENWDAQNRAEEPPPPARGTAPNMSSAFADAPAAAPTTPPPLPQKFTPAAPAALAKLPPAKPQTTAQAATLPHPPRALVGDSPAARHAPPTHLSGALRPGIGGDAVAIADTTAAPVNTPSAAEFGPWLPARPSMPGPVVTTDARGKPSITELRPPIVMVAVGETELNGKTVPAMAVVPVPGGWMPQPPDKGSDAQPGPKPPPPDGTKIDPKAGTPVGQAPAPGSGAPVGFVAAGDAAAEYLRALESDQVGYKLKIEQAVELGVVNGREFQDRREDLYLSALDVTLSRFTFAAQAFITEEAVRRSTGRALTNFRNGSETETFNTNVGLSKRFATGALLTTRLANQVLVDLSGDRPTTSISNLTLSLAQPFLRGGGKAVTLEPLTQSERTLVYAMRSYARFRKVFFVAIAAGGGYTNNPYGLQGLSPNLGRGIGGNLTAPNVGYLPLLLQSAIISNQRKNVAALEELLNTYRAYREGGQLAPLQVDQVEVQLLNSRGALLGSATGGGGTGGSGVRGFLDALDNFKLQLGLPVTVPLELNDTPLRPIRLQLGRLEAVSADARALEAAAERFDRSTPPGQFRAGWRALLTNSPLMRGTAFAKAIGPRWDEWAKLTPDEFAARMKAVRDERQRLLDARADRLLKRVPETPAEARRIDAVSADIDLGEFERAMREYEAQPWLKAGAAFVPQGVAFNRVFTAFQLLAIEARNERQEQARAQWPSLPPLPVEGANVLETSLDEAYTLGVRAALSSRLDLMNARAQVVDAWRQIAVTANSLQGVFNVRYDLSSSTAPGGNNPVGFAAARSQHQLTFNAELPLVRRAERNNYRAALIGYQRQRRLLMAFEDNIANDVRGDLRELRTLGQLYRIQQRVVELGYSQVDNARFTQFAPLSFGANSDAGSAAALTQQVLQAQSNLVQAQNGLYQIWVAYQTARMSLYLDLEQMPLDDRGVWCDEFFNRAERPEQQPAGDDRQPAERLPAPRPLDGAGREPQSPAVGGRRE
jgi:hypothetical protein